IVVLESTSLPPTYSSPPIPRHLTLRGGNMRKLWRSLLVASILCSLLVLVVSGQDDDAVWAVTEISVDVPAEPGSQVITVPMRVNVPVGQDEELPLVLDVVLHLNVTDTVRTATAFTPTVMVLPTNTPIPTPIDTPTPTPAVVPRANRSSNLRAGP